MTTATDTVHDRIARASVDVTPVQLAVGLALLAATAFALLFLQEPMLHDSLHNFRHSIGVTCH